MDAWWFLANVEIRTQIEWTIVTGSDNAVTQGASRMITSSQMKPFCKGLEGAMVLLFVQVVGGADAVRQYVAQ